MNEKARTLIELIAELVKDPDVLDEGVIITASIAIDLLRKHARITAHTVTNLDI